LALPPDGPPRRRKTSQLSALMFVSRSQDRWPQLKALHGGRSRSGTDVSQDRQPNDRHRHTSSIRFRHTAAPQLDNRIRPSSFTGSRCTFKI
jgi:hypothetical protein